jgi:hypothetical protein
LNCSLVSVCVAVHSACLIFLSVIVPC